jgi:5'-3' exonuclease
MASSGPAGLACVVPASSCSGPGTGSPPGLPAATGPVTAARSDNGQRSNPGHNDGHHLLYRAWWGFSSNRVTVADGRDLTGVFGFIALLRKAHREAAPGHEIVVAFDAEDAAAARQAADPRYKAARATADHAPIRSLGMVKECLDTAGIRWAEVPGAEGDDLLAALARAATETGSTVTCYSGDKDLYQLLSGEVSILTPTRRHVTASQLPGSHGVTPAQCIDPLVSSPVAI